MVKVVKLTSTNSSTNINQSTQIRWTDAPLIDDPPFTYDGGNSITVQEDGIYEIRSVVYHRGYSRNNTVCRIRVNGNYMDGWGGSSYIRDGNGHNHASGSPHTITRLTAGDEVDIYGWKEADGHGSYMSNDASVFFMIKYPKSVSSSSSPMKGSESGVISPNNRGVVAIKRLANKEKVKINTASLIRPDGQAVPSDVDLVIATLNNTGKVLKRKTLLNGDGSTVYDYVNGSPYNEWINSTGGDVTLAILVENNTSSNQSIYASINGELEVV